MASSDDPILDTCGLRNTFPENGWVPKTVDDYTSAYINKVSNPVVVAKDIIDKIKLVNSEMKIFCDWDENQIMQDAKDGLKNYNLFLNYNLVIQRESIPLSIVYIF